MSDEEIARKIYEELERQEAERSLGYIEDTKSTTPNVDGIVDLLAVARVVRALLTT